MPDFLHFPPFLFMIHRKIGILFFALLDSASILVGDRADIETPMAKKLYVGQTTMILTYCVFLLTFLFKRNLKGILYILLIPGIYLIPFAVLIPEYVSRGFLMQSEALEVSKMTFGLCVQTLLVPFALLTSKAAVFRKRTPDERDRPPL
jgi:hypothetical protein